MWRILCCFKQHFFFFHIFCFYKQHFYFLILLLIKNYALFFKIEVFSLTEIPIFCYDHVKADKPASGGFFI